MTKNQFIANIIFFIPLFIINFFVYGVQGCCDLVKEMHIYAKKYLTE